MVPFLQRICNEVYEKHPMLHIALLEMRPFGRHLYTVKCFACDQLRIVDRKTLQELVDKFRAKGKPVGYMFPLDLKEED